MRARARARERAGMLDTYMHTRTALHGSFGRRDQVSRERERESESESESERERWGEREQATEAPVEGPLGPSTAPDAGIINRRYLCRSRSLRSNPNRDSKPFFPFLKKNCPIVSGGKTFF
jgi:hypothetical protein